MHNIEPSGVVLHGVCDIDFDQQLLVVPRLPEHKLIIHETQEHATDRNLCPLQHQRLKRHIRQICVFNFRGGFHLNQFKRGPLTPQHIGDQVARFLDFEPGPASAQLVSNLDWTADLSALAFLRDLGARAKPIAQRDYAELAAFARDRGGQDRSVGVGPGQQYADLGCHDV
jgi:hypothetical protein